MDEDRQSQKKYYQNHKEEKEVGTMAESDWLGDNKFPTIKHGHWVWNNFYGLYNCSECRCALPDFYNDSPPNYCPNCGAKMDKGGKLR